MLRAGVVRKKERSMVSRGLGSTEIPLSLRLSAAFLIALGGCDDDNDKPMAGPPDPVSIDAGAADATTTADAQPAAPSATKGGWTQYGYDLANTQYVPGTSALSPQTVG